MVALESPSLFFFSKAVRFGISSITLPPAFDNGDFCLFKPLPIYGRPSPISPRSVSALPFNLPLAELFVY